MERSRTEWETSGVRIVAVGPGGERAAAIATRTLGMGYPVLADRRMLLARRFGFRRLLGILQESGTAVLDEAGVVRLLHRTANPGGALPMDEVRRTVDGIVRRGFTQGHERS